MKKLFQNLHIIILLVFLCVFFLPPTRVGAYMFPAAEAYAADNYDDSDYDEEEESPFSVEKEVLSFAKSDKVKVCFTIHNSGDDFQGTARLLVNDSQSKPTAYDYPIVLPKDTTKQLTIEFPMVYSSWTYDSGVFLLLNQKGATVARFPYYQNFLQEDTTLSFGILSDCYDDLTAFDLAGNSITIHTNSYRISLKELNKQSFQSSLSELSFLLIDSYHTDALSEEDYGALENYVRSGGILLVGTGEPYLHKVLSPAMQSFLNVAPMEDNNDLSPFVYGFPYDMDKVNYSPLQADSSYSVQEYFGCYSKTYYDGSINVFSYSFTDLFSMLRSSDPHFSRNDFLISILDITSQYANTSELFMDYSQKNNELRRGNYYLSILRNMDHQLKLTLLIPITLIYVVMIGPLLYFVLKKCKRCELYWGIVPILSLIFIPIIYFAGNGYAITKPQVYSITTIDSTGKNPVDTILTGFTSQKKEWNLKLDESVHNAVPMTLSDSYRSGDMNDAYLNRVQYLEDGIHIGQKPSKAFEDCSYYLTQDPITTGDFVVTTEGITNETGYDFTYLFAYYDLTFHIFEGCDNGSSVSWDNEILLPENGMTNLRDYYYMFERYYKKQKENILAPKAMLALGYTGSVIALENIDSIVIVGVIPDYQPVIDAAEDEQNFCCIYQILPY